MSKRIRKFVFNTYFRILSWRPFWLFVANAKALRREQADTQTLSLVGKRVARDLSEKGIAFSTIDELFPEKNMLPRLLAHVQEQKRKQEGGVSVQSSKPFLRFLWDRTPKLTAENPFVEVALDEEVLGIVNAYMGMYTKFYYATLNVTTPLGTGEPIASQAWHRDPEDRKICKIFIYLSDVGIENGPFIYLSESPSELRFGNFFSQRPARGIYPPAGAVESSLPKEQVSVCTGKVGTVIFCDTTGLHKGGYATSGERVMFTGGYLSSASPTKAQVVIDPALEVAVSQKGDRPRARYAILPAPTPVSSFVRSLIK